MFVSFVWFFCWFYAKMFYLFCFSVGFMLRCFCPVVSDGFIFLVFVIVFYSEIIFGCSGCFMLR